MDNRVDFRYEVTDEGTTWEMTLDREVLQQALSDPFKERITLSGTFDDDKLGKFALELVRAADKLKKLEEKRKCERTHKPSWRWPWSSK